MKKKNGKVSILGILAIVATLGLMVYVKYSANPDGTVTERLLDGLFTYVAVLFGSALLMLVFYIGMYVANLFYNAILDENNEPPKWDNAHLAHFVFFVVWYIIEITGKHITL